MANPVFSVHRPADTKSCAVFSSPHSGSDYPPEFLERTWLSRLQIRSSEDAFVDELFGCAPRLGAPLIAARVPRACVDLNRSTDDLDPALISGASRQSVNPRIAAGLGVIPRVVAEGRAIIEGKLTLPEARARLARYWHPYHAELRALLEQQRARFGIAVLFDCHSMPHDAIRAAPAVWGGRPDLVLGDRFGASCDRWLIDAATDILTRAGFAVARNAPFAGGYITQTYGQPRSGIHALQIEIDRALYMDETLIVRSADFDDVARSIEGAVAELVALGRRTLPMAAE